MKFILEAIRVVIDVYSIIILARALFTYLKMDNDNPNFIMKFLRGATEPVLGPLRNLLYMSKIVKAFPIDITYIVAYILLSVVRTFLTTIIN